MLMAFWPLEDAAAARRAGPAVRRGWRRSWARRSVEGLRVDAARPRSRRRSPRPWPRTPTGRGSTNSVAVIAAETARSSSRPTGRSRPTSRTQTMPSAMIPTGTMSKDRLTRLVLDRKVRLSSWKTAQITTMPATTGSTPRSPPRARRSEPVSWRPQPGVDRGVGRDGGGRAAVRGRPPRGRARWCCTSWRHRFLLRRGLVGLVGLVGRRATVGPAGDDVVVGPGDGRDDLLGGDGAGVEDAVVAAQAEDDDAVGDGADVLHVVADHDHAAPAVAQPLDEVEHLGGLGDAERGGRLVEDDHLRVTQQRAGDGDGLPLPAREGRDRHLQAGEPGRELAQQLPRADLHGHVVEGHRAQLLAEEQVRGHVEVLAEGQVLEDRGDADGVRLGGRADLALDALEARWCPRRAGARRRAP